MVNYFLLGIFIILLINYFLFLYGILSGLKKIKQCKSKELDEFISVIVPFRNESENILSSLKSLSEQNYPENKFEIIFVNDSSEDNSLQILLNNNKNKNVKVLNVPESFSDNSGKKRAVKYGIKNSIGDIIVTTDADCIHSNNWLLSLLQCMDEKTGFVSGPVEFDDGPSLFSKLQKLEFAGLVLTGAGLIGINKPAICNGANIAYRKKTFLEAGGFNHKMKLSSGDDEILMQNIRKKTDYKIKFCWDPGALVKTSSNEDFSRFYHQRKRWASKGLFYISKLLVFKLILIYLFYLGLVLQLLLGVITSYIFFISFLLSIIIKTLVEYRVVKRGEKLLSLKSVMKLFPFAEILQIPYIIIAGISGLAGNFEWKQRKLKR